MSSTRSRVQPDARRHALYLTTALASSVWVLLYAPAIAQTTAPAATQPSAASRGAETKPDEKKSDETAAPEEIVVTGTLIRGVAPAGSQVIGISSANVVATGAVSTNQLLANVPQVSNFFNTLPEIITGANGVIQIIRPNLRNLPHANTSSGASTLVLVDGHRVVGAGVNQDAPDPDIVPPNAIERVEIFTDGGSSIYGADAIGGVINFITRKRFDGAQIDVRYGFADSYNQADVAGIVGQDWGTGSAYLSYDFTTHDALFGRDRSYDKSIDWNTGIPAGRTCTPPNIAVGSTYYALPGLVPGTFNACDLSNNQTIYPQEDRHSVYAGLSQDISDSIKLDVRAFFARREDETNSGPGTLTVSVKPTNPFYINLPGAAANQTQNVFLSLAPVSGIAFQDQKTTLEEWGVTPTITVDLGGDWQLRGMANYGGSETTYFTQLLNPTLPQQYASGTTSTTAINPYNIVATPNQQLIANIQNWQNAGEGDIGLFNFRAVGDGTLFSLPGGAVHAASGVEYIQDSFRSRTGQTVLGGQSTLPFHAYWRDVKSAFAELQIPVFGEDFTLPLVEAFSISASARYDYYSDFGHTFNPRVGVTYKPIDWINVRGNWGTSFNAPTPVDQLGAINSTITAGNAPGALFIPPGGPQPNPGTYSVVLQGSRPHLQPQTGDTRSFGIDVDPPIVPGLRASVTYYYIDFFGSLGSPPFTTPDLFFPNYKGFYTINPSPQQVQAFASQAPGGLANVSALLAPGTVYELIDARKTNLGDAKISGLDWSLEYSRDTDFGSVDAAISGNNLLKDYLNKGPATAYINQIGFGASLFRFAVTVGANIGNLRAQATLNHSQGYNVIESPNLPQTHVGSFNVVNLFFKYDLEGTGWSKDMSLSLGIDNVFDQNPPVYKQLGTVPGSGGGYANGATLGRLVQIGFSKKF